MRIRHWLIRIVCVAALMGQAALSLTQSPFVEVEFKVLAPLIAVVVVVQIVRSARRTGIATRAIAPGVQGLGEVQDMYLGRLPVPAATYGKPEGVVAEATTAWRDPLAETTWIVGQSHQDAQGPTTLDA